MTKKDYELIAEAINSTVSHYHPWAISNVMNEALEALCEALKLDNPNFDRDKFMTACGMNRQVD